MKGALAVLLLVLAVCSAAIRDAAPASGRPAGAQKRCATGSVAAVISHKRVCLRAGQRCVPGHASQYRQHGFRCPLNARLERIPPPAGSVITEISSLLGPYAAAGEGAIWARGSDEQVLRIDPAQNAVADRIQLPPPESPRPFSLLSGIAAGEGGVWVSLASHDEVVRIDPSTDAIVARIPVDQAPAGIALTTGSVWVANRFGHSVSRIDTRTNRVVATITLSREPAEGPYSIAAGAGAVWTVDPGLGEVVRINPATNAIDARIPVRIPPNFGAVNEIAADDAAGVWVAGADIVRIDPATNRVVATVPMRGLPAGVAIGLGSVWTTSFAGWAAPGILSRISPAANTVVGESSVGSAYSAVAVGFGSVLLQGERLGLLRIRPN